MINTVKPTTASLTNTAKPTSASLENTAKPSFSPLWVSTVLPWQLSTPWLLFGTMTNVVKPS